MSSDLRALLHNADAGSWEPLDLDAVVREARLRTRQRRILQALAGVVVVVAVALASPSMFRQLGIQKVDTADRPPTELSQDASGGEGSRSDSLGPGSVSVDGSRGAGRVSSSGGGSKSGSVTNPAGDRIAFVAGPSGQGEIYVMNLDGSGKTLLGPGSEPDWSPDGSRILYSLDRTGGECVVKGPPCDIWVMNADGSNRRLVGAGRWPDWSPDGRRIAYVLLERDVAEIYVMNADGSGSVKLTQTPDWSVSPDWSPDGSRITFSRQEPCGPACSDTHIYVMNADGSGRQILTNQAGARDPVWSPGGTHIAFSGTPVNQSDNAEIFTMNGDGSDLRRLTYDAKANSPMDNFDGWPAWSPDGRIIFTRDIDGPTGWSSCWVYNAQPNCGAGGPALPEIFLMNTDGSARIRIVQGSMPAFAPRRR